MNDLRITPLPSLTFEEAFRRRSEWESQLQRSEAPTTVAPAPVDAEGRTKNLLRPQSFDEVLGQDRAVGLLRRVVDAAKRRQQALDHVLMVGPAGTGKTTMATVIANELGVDCYQIAAPVSLDTLLALRTSMKERSILFIDEIHMQAVMERRGKEAATQPEVFLHLLEDSVIATEGDMLPFPAITVIGATTDPGRLPAPFLDRFPLQPRLETYSTLALAKMAVWNAGRLDLEITNDAAADFALAARGTPRLINRYMTNAASLMDDQQRTIDTDTTAIVLHELNDVTFDGLSRDQQETLRFLYTRGKRTLANEEVRYQSSVSTLATAIGLSRDQKAFQLYVEPFLITQGFLQVGHGGRFLTDAGIERARQLLGEA